MKTDGSVFKQIRRNFPDISYPSGTQTNNFQFLNEPFAMRHQYLLLE